jgi:hypothetical protein
VVAGRRQVRSARRARGNRYGAALGARRRHGRRPARRVYALVAPRAAVARQARVTAVFDDRTRSVRVVVLTCPPEPTSRTTLEQKLDLLCRYYGEEVNGEENGFESHGSSFQNDCVGQPSIQTASRATS